jgi:hypothetical protein
MFVERLNLRGSLARYRMIPRSSVLRDPALSALLQMKRNRADEVGPIPKQPAGKRRIGLIAFTARASFFRQSCPVQLP